MTEKAAAEMIEELLETTHAAMTQVVAQRKYLLSVSRKKLDVMIPAHATVAVSTKSVAPKSRADT